MSNLESLLLNDSSDEDVEIMSGTVTSSVIAAAAQSRITSSFSKPTEVPNRRPVLSGSLPSMTTTQLQVAERLLPEAARSQLSPFVPNQRGESQLQMQRFVTPQKADGVSRTVPPSQNITQGTVRLPPQTFTKNLPAHVPHHPLQAQQSLSGPRKALVLTSFMNLLKHAGLGTLNPKQQHKMITILMNAANEHVIKGGAVTESMITSEFCRHMQNEKFGAESISTAVAIFQREWSDIEKKFAFAAQSQSATQSMIATPIAAQHHPSAVRGGKVINAMKSAVLPVGERIQLQQQKETTVSMFRSEGKTLRLPPTIPPSNELVEGTGEEEKQADLIKFDEKTMDFEDDVENHTVVTKEEISLHDTKMQKEIDAFVQVKPYSGSLHRGWWRKNVVDHRVAWSKLAEGWRDTGVIVPAQVTNMGASSLHKRDIDWRPMPGWEHGEGAAKSQLCELISNATQLYLKNVVKSLIGASWHRRYGLAHSISENAVAAVTSKHVNKRESIGGFAVVLDNTEVKLAQFEAEQHKMECALREQNWILQFRSTHVEPDPNVRPVHGTVPVDFKQIALLELKRKLNSECNGYNEDCEMSRTKRLQISRGQYLSPSEESPSIHSDALLTNKNEELSSRNGDRFSLEFFVKKMNKCLGEKGKNMVTIEDLIRYISSLPPASQKNSCFFVRSVQEASVKELDM